jgi:hypothetical protein
VLGAQGDGPAPARDLELTYPLFLVITASDPHLAFQVRGDTADLQQVLTGARRGEQQPVFIISRVDRVKLGGIISNPNRRFACVVGLENIRAPDVDLRAGGRANLRYIQPIAADIVIVIGLDSDLEVSDARCDIQMDLAVTASVDLELLDAFLLVATALDPEFTLEVNRNVCQRQDVSPGLAGHEHDPIFVAVGVYRVKLRLAREYLHRQVAFRVRLEFVAPIEMPRPSRRNADQNARQNCR